MCRPRRRIDRRCCRDSDGSAAAAREFVQALFDAGVIAFVAGANPTRVRFLLPAGAIDEKDIDVVCGILENTLVEFAGR